MSALGFTLMGSIIFGVMFSVMASWYRKDKPLELPVVGRAHVPSLIAFLERSGAQLSEPPADYEARIQAGKLDAVLVIPEDYGKSFEAGRTAEVHLVMDNSRDVDDHREAREFGRAGLSGGARRGGETGKVEPVSTCTSIPWHLP